MAHDVAMYGIVQKDGLGFDRAVEECKARMSRYSVTVRFLATLFRRCVVKGSRFDGVCARSQTC